MAAAAPPLLNGILPSPLHNVDEAAEYEKILKLRDEVFAGSHPRLTVPAHVVRNFSPRPPQSSSQPSLAVSSIFPTSTSPNQAATQSPKPPDAIASASTSFTTAAATQAQASTPPVPPSDFNPVLLQKSNDLLQAEIRIRRQRLEKTLKEQFEQKRLEARRKPAPAEAKPDFDISVILAKVLEDLKPASAKDDGDASDSFDENSLYSSRAPDSTPERGPPSPSPDENEENADADLPSDNRMQSAVMGAPLNSHGGRDEPQSPPYVPREPAPEHMDLDDDDEEEEGEYSPPEAVENGNNALDENTSMYDTQDPRGRPLRRYSEIDEGRRPLSPNMRIVRNHITSPYAPQPSRVSPLAVAKDAPFEQNPRMRKQRQGPNGSPEPLNPRKKRKLDRKERRARRNGGLSPDAFVKEENVSPPPFHEVQPLGSVRPQAVNRDRPIVIDDGPQDVRYVTADGRYIDPPPRPLSRHFEQPMPMSEPRAVSHATMRPMRDDQDLRRVASLHNMRAEPPRQYADSGYETPSRRVASYRESSPTISERQRIDESYYDRQPLQEVRLRPTPNPGYREVYRDEQQQTRYELVPPPSVERIIIGEDGRRYREVIQPPLDRLPPVQQRAASVRPMDPPPPQYETYRSGRAGSVMLETPSGRYMQGMPPPGSSYRQEQMIRPSAVPVPQPREQYEQPPSVRSASVQIIDRPSRAPVYVDDRGNYGEPVRMSSVRPAPSRHEESPREGVVRAASVRPTRQDPGFAEDRGQVRYVQVEQARYRAVEPEERYYDSQGREVIIQRGAPRY